MSTTIIDIPEWMLPLSAQGTEIHHTILSKTGEDEWELGDIASRVKVTRLQEELSKVEGIAQEQVRIAEKSHSLRVAELEQSLASAKTDGERLKSEAWKELTQWSEVVGLMEGAIRGVMMQCSPELNASLEAILEDARKKLPQRSGAWPSS